MHKIIESVLVSELGQYLDGLKDNLDVSFFNGEVKMNNVSLKKSFINQLNLPFNLLFSHIQHVHIDVPWTNLKDKNTIVTIQGLYLLLEVGI